MLLAPEVDDSLTGLMLERGASEGRSWLAAMGGQVQDSRAIWHRQGASSASEGR